MAKAKLLDRPITNVVVMTQAWRAAVSATYPHATTDPDWSRFYRIRMYVGPARMTVAAATPWTFGIASLQIEEHLSEELGCFDMLPGDAREVARLFKPGKDEGEYAKLQFEVREKELTVTDVGGFFPGKALTLNGTPTDEQFPDLAQMLKLIDARGRGYVPPPGYRTLASGQYVQAFTAAATAYGAGLSMQPTGQHAPLIVTCGEHFIGGLMPQSQSDDTDRGYADLRAEWWDRLTDIQASHPRHPQQKLDKDAELTVVLLGGVDDRPVKGKAKKAAEEEPPEPDEPDDLDDGEPDQPEVESLPLFDDGERRSVQDEQLPEDEELRDLAETAARHFWIRQGNGPLTTSGVGLKQLLQVGHAKASAVLDILIAAGAVEGGELNPPRARRVLVGDEIHIDVVVRRLRGAS